MHTFMRDFEELRDRRVAEAGKHADSVLSQDANKDEDRRWPLAYTVVFVVVSSACLWGAIIIGLAHLL